MANTRRDAIVRMLIGREILEVVPMGSLMRGTGLRGRSDLDLMLVLHDGHHVKGKSPRQVLEETRDALGTYRAKIVRRNGQAVTLYFDSWPAVDVVPAVRVAAPADGSAPAHYHIPDPARGEWIATLPQQHDNMIRSSLSCRADLLKMLKTWNLAHSKYLESFHLEVLARDIPIFRGDAPFSLPEWTWTLYKAFELIVERLDEPCILWAPYSHVDEYLTYAERHEAQERARAAAALASDAWLLTYGDKAEHRAAGELWGRIFGDQFPLGG